MLGCVGILWGGTSNVSSIAEMGCVGWVLMMRRLGPMVE